MNDTRALLRALEDYIRLCPEQYCWIHQRFKGRPRRCRIFTPRPRRPGNPLEAASRRADQVVAGSVARALLGAALLAHWLVLAILPVVGACRSRGSSRPGAGSVGLACAAVKRREQRVARRNLEVCFPSSDAAEREDLARCASSNPSVSRSSRWQSAGSRRSTTWSRRVAIHGREHLERALAAGSGVCCSGAHFTRSSSASRRAPGDHPARSCMYRHATQRYDGS